MAKINMRNRKIGRKGLHSLDVILPAVWVQLHNVGAGDSVRMEILDSGELLIGVVSR